MHFVFEEENVVNGQENRKNRIFRLTNVSKDLWNESCEQLLSDGYVKKEEYDTDAKRFTAFEKEGLGIFLNYYKNTLDIHTTYGTAIPHRGCRL